MKRPTFCWPPKRPCTRTGTPWFGGASSFIPLSGARGRSARSGSRIFSRSPRSPTAALTSTLSGRTRPRSCCEDSAPTSAKTPNERDAQRGESEHGSRAGMTARRRTRGVGVPGWDPTRGRLVIDTPFTQGMAGWFGGEPIALLQRGGLFRQPVRGGRRQRSGPGADCHCQAAARHGRGTGATDGFPLGRSVQARGRRSRVARPFFKSRSSPGWSGGVRERSRATC